MDGFLLLSLLFLYSMMYFMTNVQILHAVRWDLCIDVQFDLRYVHLNLHFFNQPVDVTSTCLFFSTLLQGSGATSGNLYIIGAQFKHEGLYTCQVTSGTTAVSSSAYLTVRGECFDGKNLVIDFFNTGSSSPSKVTWVLLASILDPVIDPFMFTMNPVMYRTCG